MITYGIENKSDLMANDIIKKENERAIDKQ